MGIKYNHLTESDRNKIEALVKEKHTAKEIAINIGCSVATIYNELKRGKCTLVNTYLIEYTSYSAYIAQQKYNYNLEGKGGQLKIGNDYELVDYIEHKIINKDYSPDALIGELRLNGNPFNTDICTKTLYSYIDKGIFPNLTNKNLLVKSKRKRKYRNTSKRISNPKGTSIEKRSKNIENRLDFGHWEMDTVVGTRKGTSTSLLVLSERKTRYEIIIKMEYNKTQNVINALNSLERKYRKDFSKIFKTIIVDNGAEFMDYKSTEKSYIYKNKYRTKLYYCHSYSSWERGTNKNINKMIRRFIPKGTSLKNISPNHINHIQDYINNYPRKILDYHSSNYHFQQELQLLTFNELF